ncbi:MAG: hypothetical protein CL933_23580 [Deltaproteobacteria bacterium]|nr:hypothetical protein [Deltaproteobacteria bacterium]
MGLVLGLGVPLAGSTQTAAIDIVCRPDGNSTDVLDVQWVDTKTGNVEYDLERQYVSGGRLVSRRHPADVADLLAVLNDALLSPDLTLIFGHLDPPDCPPSS